MRTLFISQHLWELVDKDDKEEDIKDSTKKDGKALFFHPTSCFRSY